MDGQPFVITGKTDSWSSSCWTIDNLSSVLKKSVLFRIGKKNSHDVQYETDCDYVEASVTDFEKWINDKHLSAGDGPQPFTGYKTQDHWAYADYKYMKDLFSSTPDLLNVVDWGSVGLTGRNGKESTFWLGSASAYTCCHYDTYGCNLVAQICGRKRWTLFPPDQTTSMYPTRIPYEESSVFSEVNIKQPDLEKHPNFQNTTPYVVTLNPGDMLYVPRHWWHFVECLEASISINTWLEMDEDQEERVKEAVCRSVISALMQETDVDWLNPTETELSADGNLSLLNASFQQLPGSSCKKEEMHSNSLIHQFHEHILNTDTKLCKCEKYTFREYLKVCGISCVKKVKHLLEEDEHSREVQVPFKKVKVDRQETEPDKLHTNIEHENMTQSTTELKCDSELNFHQELSTQDIVNCIVDKEVMSLICQKLKQKLKSSS